MYHKSTRLNTSMGQFLSCNIVCLVCDKRCHQVISPCYQTGYLVLSLVHLLASLVSSSASSLPSAGSGQLLGQVRCHVQSVARSGHLFVCIHELKASKAPFIISQKVNNLN